MAMEVRLADAARLTKDLDLGLREAAVDPVDLRERLIEALAVDDDVRDLADLVLLLEAELLDPDRLTAVVTDVWRERDGTTPPATLSDLPASWPVRYELLAEENDIKPRSFTAAVERIAALWHSMFGR